MFRILAALFALNFILLLTDGFYESGGGIQTTTLDVAITEVSTTITANTTGFASNQTIRINNEDILVTSLDATHFYTSTPYRGWNDTEIDSHAAGALIYTPGSSLINDMMNFDITTTETGGGASGDSEGSVVSIDEDFWGRSIPKMFYWNYGIFTDNDLNIIRYFLMGVCGILTAIIALNMLPFVNFG